MSFVFNSKTDTENIVIDRTTKENEQSTLNSLLTPILRKRKENKEKEAEQVVQEVKRQKEEDRENHPNTLLRIRFNVWLTMFIFGESLIGAGAIVHAVGGSHMVVGGLLLAGAITVFVSFSIMVWKTLKGPFN